MDKGISDPEVQGMIAEHHKGINFFYDCDYNLYRNLGQLYINDPRYGRYYEKHRKGLAQFMTDAISYYCDEKNK
jgi:MerR family transcriptional regulator, multidrug-efflux activator